MSRSNNNNPEPGWSGFIASHSSGDVLDGRVTSIVSFGAFVEVAPGIDGLVHVSEWRERPELEQRMRVRIHDIDREQRRLSLVPE